MKFCPVVPPLCYTELPEAPHGMFAFAPSLFGQKYGDSYRVWNATALSDERGPLVIDCPIYEGFEASDPEALKEIERLYNPRFLIVPDVRGQLGPTLDRFEVYQRYLGDAATGVLQGQTWQELEKCAEQMLQYTSKLAIPKDVAKLDISRYEMCTQLLAVWPHIEIHLLGGDWPYVDEGKCARFEQVISFDSAEPFNGAYAGLDLAKAPPPHRPEGWANLQPNKLGGGFRRDFGRNIETVERLAKCN